LSIQKRELKECLKIVYSERINKAEKLREEGINPYPNLHHRQELHQPI